MISVHERAVSVRVVWCEYSWMMESMRLINVEVGESEKGTSAFISS